jgi:hypothetical protein
MNDLEHDLRELFDRKASSVGGVEPRLPEGVRRRSRRRQLGTALVSAASVIALVVGSVGILRAIDPGSDRGSMPVEDPWAGYDVFERTATIGNFTITSPSDWYLVNQWWIGAGTITSFAGGTETCEIDVEGTEDCETVVSRPSSVPVPEGLPLLQLSNIDLGLGMPRCGDRLTDEEAVLYVALDDPMASRETHPAWPSTLEERTSGPCGPGLYSSFSVGATSFIAWVGFGAEASSEDRAELLAAFDRMEVSDGALRPPQTVGPAYVIAGGENAAGPWRLELQPSRGDGPNADVELHLQGSEGEGPSADSFTVPKIPIEAVGGDPMFGAVTKEASGVELRLEAGTPPIPATIVPLPPSMPFEFDLFFASNDADVQADAVAIGPAGEQLGRSEVPLASESPAPDGRQATRTVAEGVTGNMPWILEFSRVPGELKLTLRDRRDGSVLAELKPGILLRVHTSGLEFWAEAIPGGSVLIFGVTAPAATRLAIALDNGRVTHLEPGDPRWDPLPTLTSTGQPALRLWWSEIPIDVGEVVTFSENCDVLARKVFIPDHAVRSAPEQTIDPRIECDPN